MFKKFYISATITMFSFLLAQASIEQINGLKNDINHITQAIADSKIEINKALAITYDAMAYFKNNYGLSYYDYKSQVLPILKHVILLDEFTQTLDEITDLYVDLIVNHHMNLKDITIKFTNQYLEDQIYALVDQTLPPLNEQALYIFDVFYVITSDIKGVDLLCKKLTIKINELLTELIELKDI